MLGIRVNYEPTPLGRLAAVARTVVDEHRDLSDRLCRPDLAFPDCADFRDRMNLYVKRELLLARMEEARLHNWPGAALRIAALEWQLTEVQEQIDEDNTERRHRR
jgi:hypothetical protein